MSDEVKPVDDGIRRTLSLTHKQAGFTATGIAALTAVLVGPLSQVFQTKLDASKQSGLIAVQASQITDLKAVMEANKMEILNAVNGVMKPVAKEVDQHETRIVNLEFILMNKGVKK